MDKNIVPVLFITYNRLEYTKKALAALLKTNYPILIMIWDNASTDGTVEWLRDLEFENKIALIHYSATNVGINKAFNYFIKVFKKHPFIAKVDNDTIVSPEWIDVLLDKMKRFKNLDACGAFMQRPPGQVFQHWVDTCMKKEEYIVEKVIYGEQINDNYGVEVKSAKEKYYIAYNSYTGGTGVLIRTKIFWDEGLLWEGYPCALGDWTTFQRLLFVKKGERNIAWCSETTVKLLNIAIDGMTLTNDFPEYDEELKKVRDEGNDWYVKIGGPAGIAALIEKEGGRERLKNNDI